QKTKTKKKKKKKKKKKGDPTLIGCLATQARNTALSLRSSSQSHSCAQVRPFLSRPDHSVRNHHLPSSNTCSCIAFTLPRLGFSSTCNTFVTITHIERWDSLHQKFVHVQ